VERYDEWHKLITERARLKVINDDLVKALSPFAEYADHRNVCPADNVITIGSTIAKRQLTMGDCYEARNAIAKAK